MKTDPSGKLVGCEFRKEINGNLSVAGDNDLGDGPAGCLYTLTPGA